MKRLFKSLLAGFLACSFAQAANAWGDRERAALIGFAVGATLFSATQPSQRVWITDGYRNEPVFVPPVAASVYVPAYSPPIRGSGHFDSDIQSAYNRGVADRLRVERERALRDAYRAGYELR